MDLKEAAKKVIERSKEAAKKDGVEDEDGWIDYVLDEATVEAEKPVDKDEGDFAKELFSKSDSNTILEAAEAVFEPNKFMEFCQELLYHLILNEVGDATTGDRKTSKIWTNS